MNEEMQSLKKNQTWELVPLPKSLKPVQMGVQEERRDS